MKLTSRQKLHHIVACEISSLLDDGYIITKHERNCNDLDVVLKHDNNNVIKMRILYDTDDCLVYKNDKFQRKINV